MTPDPLGLTIAGLNGKKSPELSRRSTWLTRGPVLAWTPLIDAVVAAVGGDQQATAGLEAVLAELAKDPDWTALSGVLSRILAGERGQ